MNRSNSTDLVASERPARLEGHSIRNSAKSVGIITIAAALVGSLALPAAAFQPTSHDEVLDGSIAELVAQNEQSVVAPESAAVSLLARDGLQSTTPEELAQIQAAAAAAAAQRQAEAEAARAAAAEAAAQTAGTASTTSSARTTVAAVSAPVAASAGDGSIVSTAASQLGVPYVWGGTSPSTGFDCSGFTAWVFGQHGVYLPHSSGAQAGYGTPVSASSVAPGDLIVWKGHVAIYAGNNQIIHAATSGTPVKYSSYSAMVAAMGTPQVRRF